MESPIIIAIIVIGFGVLTYASKRRAAQEARRLAEADARRIRMEQEEAQRRATEDVRRKESERLAAIEFRDSIKSAINVAVNAAIEATIIGTGIAETECKVVHIVASAIEAAGVAESTDASVQTFAGEIEAARLVAFTDAISRSDTSARTGARKAASLEPSERTDIVKDARIAAVEATMVIAIKDTLANLRANGEPRKITFARANAIPSNTLARIVEVAHEIEKVRANRIEQVRISENDRIEAIINAIETQNETYVRIASSIAARRRANAMKATRTETRDDTSRAIVTKAIELLIRDSNTQEEAFEGAIVPRIMAAITTNVIDRIEDAIEDAVAATNMRAGSIQDTIVPSIANAIEISSQDEILELIECVRVCKDQEEFAGDDTEPFHEVDELPSQLNVPD